MNTEEVIHEAGKKLVTVTFDYTESDGTNEGTREVEPYSYRETAGTRKFMGYDVQKNGMRSFLPKNIHNITMTDNTYAPRWAVET